MEEEKDVLQAQKREAQQEKLTIRDELVRLEQDRLELDAARIKLQHSLQDVELSRVGLDAELQSLREEKFNLQERVTQVQNSLEFPTQQSKEGKDCSVIHSLLFCFCFFFWQLCGEVSSLGSELSLAKVEGQRSVVALEEAGRSQAELVRDKAALVVQLTASEKDNTALSEELAAFRCARVWEAGLLSRHPAWVTCGCWDCRSERESLETSLFEAQQQMVQAESRREQLEAENQILRVRSETAAGE